MKDYPTFAAPDRKTKNNEPRAKVYLRSRLGWLWGYPLERTEAGLSWQQFYLPSPWDNDVLTITTNELAQAGNTYNRVFNTFPKALPEVVGDTQAWKQQIQLKLQAIRNQLLGQSVNVWQDLFTAEPKAARLVKRAQALKLSAPALSTLIDQFAWWLSLDLQVLEQALEWLTQEQVPLSVIAQQYPNPTLAAVTLFALYQENPSVKHTKLLEVLTHTAWNAQGIYNQIQRLKDSNQYFTKVGAKRDWTEQEPFLLEPNALGYESWQTWLASLVPMVIKERRRQMEAVVLFYTPKLLNYCQDWCEKNEVFYERFETLKARQYKAEYYQHLPDREVFELRKSRINELKKHREELIELIPFGFETKALRKWLTRHAATPDGLEFLSTLNHLLEKLPEHPVWGKADALAGLCTYWAQTERYYTTPECYQFVLQTWLKYLKQATARDIFTATDMLVARLVPYEILIEPRSTQLNSHFSKSIVETKLVDCWEPKERIQLSYQRLGQWCSLAGLYAKSYEPFLNMWLYAPIHWDSIEYTKALVDQKLSLEISSYKIDFIETCLKTQNDASPETFIRIIQDWHLTETEEQQTYYALRHKLIAGSWLITYGCADVLKVIIANPVGTVWGQSNNDAYQPTRDTQRQKLHDLLAKTIIYIDALQHSKQIVPQPISYQRNYPNEWSTYPTELADALTFVLRYHARPLETAERILGKEFPSKAKIQQQISTIEQKLTTLEPSTPAYINLQKGLANLQQHLTQIATISPIRLEHLREKLYLATALHVMEQWHVQCTQSLQVQIKTMLAWEGNLPLEWLTENTKQQTLLGFTRLSPEEKRLAGKLLKAEMEQNYPLIHEPANANWLQTMQNKKLDLTVWLQGFTQQHLVITNQKSQVVTFKMAQSVWDVFHMGDHFNTCLRHNGCNFFSVITNAADINKRVIYAYNASGEVLARCLVAITDKGELVNFRYYSHLAGAALYSSFDLVLNYLAKQLNTTRAQNGKISTLLAKEWYDDGIQPLRADYQSHTERALDSVAPLFKTATASELLEHYQQALLPEVLDETLMWNLIDYHPIYEYPTLRLELAVEANTAGLLSEEMQQRVVRELFTFTYKHHSDALWSLAHRWIRPYIESCVKRGRYLPFEIMLLREYEPVKVLRIINGLKHIIAEFEPEWQADAQIHYAYALFACNRPRQALEALQRAKQLDNKRLDDALEAICLETLVKMQRNHAEG